MNKKRFLLSNIRNSKCVRNCLKKFKKGLSLFKRSWNYLFDKIVVLSWESNEQDA